MFEGEYLNGKRNGKGNEYYNESKKDKLSKIFLKKKGKVKKRSRSL